MIAFLIISTIVVASGILFLLRLLVAGVEVFIEDQIDYAQDRQEEKRERLERFEDNRSIHVHYYGRQEQKVKQLDDHAQDGKGAHFG